MKTTNSLATHIANGTPIYAEEQHDIADVGTTRSSLSAATVLSRCAKNNVQTNTSFAQRKASVSSLYLAIPPSIVKLHKSTQTKVR